MKLNCKGVSIVEVVITFSMIMVMVVGMFSIVINYRNKASITLEKMKMDTFKNTLTKDIQDDILKFGVKEIKPDTGKCLEKAKEFSQCINIVYNNGEEKIFGIGKIGEGNTDEEIRKSIENKYLYYDGLKYEIKDYFSEKMLKMIENMSQKRKLTDFQTINIIDSNMLTIDSMVSPDGKVIYFYSIDVYISHLDFDQDFGIHIAISTDAAFASSV